MSFIIPSYIKRASLLIILLLCWASSVVAQSYALEGRVLDESGELGLPGATIQIKGTGIGTSSDIDGRFSFEAIGGDAVLIISFIGYTAQEIEVAGQKSITVTLLPANALLDEVVVTALGISRKEKSLGYAVGKMDVKSATTIRDPNVANSMQGKIAGVSISKTSGGPGASSRILIRGTSSVSDNNQPLVVVDGIPIDNQTTGAAGQWGGIDYGSPISDINPDDIESLTVLKGPSAAALYGSRALNGVIVVTTKKGSKKKGWSVSANSNSSVETAYILKDFQDTYGAGSRGEFDFTPEGIPFFNTTRPNLPTFASSWGPEMLDQQYIDWNGDTTTFSPQADNYKEFFQTGYTFTNSASITYGGAFPVRISFTDLRNRGISPTSTFKRNNISASNGGQITKKLSYALKYTYARQRAYNRVNQSNGHNAARNIIMMPRNVTAESLMDFEDEEGNENVWYQAGGWVGNPFFTLARSINYDSRNRHLGNLSLTYQLSDHLSLMTRIGADHYLENRHSRLAQGSIGVPLGEFNEQEIQFTELNADYLLSYAKPLSDDWDLNVNLGGNAMKQDREVLGRRANDLIERGIYTIENAAPQNKDERTLVTRRALNSAYGSAQLGYKGYAYLDITGRNDWSSTLPDANNSYFYSSIGASFVLSEYLKESPQWLSFAKLRASWAQVGNDAPPYLLEVVYDSLGVFDGRVLSTINNPFPLTNVQPERKTSFEVGTDIRFWGNRFGIDFTYYDESTVNQIVQSTVSAASGQQSAIVNGGEIRNRGIELLVNSTLIDGKYFKWYNTVNFTQNRNEVLSLSTNGLTQELGEQWRILITASPGQPYGSIYGFGIQRDDEGTPLLSADGTYLRTEDRILLGNNTPDWKMGVGNTFSYKQWGLTFLIDVQKGGDIYSATNMYMHGYAGNARATLEGRAEWYASEAERLEQGIDANSFNEQTGDYALNWQATGGYELSGVYAEGTSINGEDMSGETDTRKIDPQTYWSQFAAWENEIHEPFIYDASYVKLRELGLSYAFKEAAIHKKITNASITLTGRNLWLIFSNVPNVDPEATYNNGNGQGVEYATYPITRSIGINLSANF